MNSMNESNDIHGHSTRTSFLLPIGMGILGVIAMVISTYQGPGVAGDATIYLKSAENLIRGNGLGLVGPLGEFRLLPYFPPLFPLIISALGLLGLDLVAGAHWLNVLLFGALISMAGWFTMRVTRSPLLSCVFMFLLLASPVLIPIYSWLMSEPLSFFLGFLGLGLLYLSLDDNSKKVAFYGSAVLTGLSFLTRYSSAAFIGAAVLGWFLLAGGSWKGRLLDGIKYLILAGLPMIAWIVYDLSQTSTVASRSFEDTTEIGWRFSNLWPSLEEVFLFWIIPDSWVFTPEYNPLYNHILFILLFFLFLALLIVVVKNLIPKLGQPFYIHHFRFGSLLTIFSLSYLAVISLVYIFTFPPITIYHRMVAPVHIAFLWLMILLISTILKFGNTKRIWSHLMLIGLVFLTFWYGWRTTRIVQQNYRVGFGYTAPEWRESETIERIKAFPLDALLITNEQNAILFLTDRPSYPMKEIYRVEPLSVFFSFGSGDVELDETQKLFREGAALVLFNSIQRQFGDLYKEKADDRIEKLTEGLYQAFEGNDGSIYYINQETAVKSGWPE